MGGAHSRNKGANFERHIANVFKELGFKDARRKIEYRDGAGYDVDGTGPWRIQAKRYKGYAPITKIEEVPKTSDTMPLLITKADAKPAVACMYLDDLIKVLSDIGKAYERESNE